MESEEFNSVQTIISSKGVNEMKIFSVEDTLDGCYRDISSALVQRGWRNSSTKKMSKFEKRR